MKKFNYFVPKKDGRLLAWAANYKEKIAAFGLQLGLSAEVIAQQQSTAQIVIDKLNKVEQKRSEFAQAVTAKKLLPSTELKDLLNATAGYKRSKGYTEDIGRELGVVGTSSSISTADLNPSVKLSTEPGLVKVVFNKQKMYGVTIFCRLKDSTGWDEIISVAKSPYLDKRPLAETGKPEVREYMVRCYNGIEDVGRESDIATILFGG